MEKTNAPVDVPTESFVRAYERHFATQLNVWLHCLPFSQNRLVLLTGMVTFSLKKKHFLPPNLWKTCAFGQSGFPLGAGETQWNFGKPVQLSLIWWLSSIMHATATLSSGHYLAACSIFGGANFAIQTRSLGGMSCLLFLWAGYFCVFPNFKIVYQNLYILLSCFGQKLYCLYNEEA